MPLEERNVVDSFVGLMDHTCEDVVTKKLDMESAHLKLDYLFENEVLQLVVIQVQVALWKPHQ
jgi:hypothetical protein